LFSPSLDQKIRLGRNKKSSVCGSSFVDVSAPNTVRRTTLLPRYHPIGQNTTKITPDELNLNAEYFFRFREAMILSLVNHPNILRFHSPLITADHSITLEAPLLQHDVEFLASEMLDGSPSEVMETIRSIMTQLLLAVHYLHSLSVLHLNIKPSSLLIHRNHPTDPAQAYLTAFSKARAKGSHDSFVATLDLSDYPYSLAYMSPQFAEVAEAARSGRPSPKIDFNAVDMWSVGCVLACLLGRGCDLFRGATNAHSLDELARQVNVDFINRFVTNSMRRRRRRGLPDLAQAPQYKAAVKLTAELLQYNPANRPSALQALQSQFINLNQDIVPPTVQEPFDDEALPRFALLHRGVPNRFEIVHPDD
jgi:serine/threonine protein kinase